MNTKKGKDNDTNLSDALKGAAIGVTAGAATIGVNNAVNKKVTDLANKQIADNISNLGQKAPPES